MYVCAMHDVAICNVRIWIFWMWFKLGRDTSYANSPSRWKVIKLQIIHDLVIFGNPVTGFQGRKRTESCISILDAVSAEGNMTRR